MENKQETIFKQLENIIDQRMTQSPDDSYVAKLNHEGVNSLLKKIGEEAAEVIIAAKDDNKSDIIYESADLVFHLMLLLRNKGIKMGDIQVELQRRLGHSGITEKASRQPK